MASLERIFIENKIYQAIEGKKSREEAYEAVDERLAPFKKLLRREVTHEDVVAYRACGSSASRNTTPPRPTTR